MKKRTCPYAVCPGKENCALTDSLANPLSTNPRRDDRPDTIRTMRDCPNAAELRQQYPQLFRRARV